MDLKGYQTSETLYRSDNSIILRATDEASGRPVIIKMLPEELASPDRLARMEREFHVTTAVEADGVIKAHALHLDYDRPFMVLEDFGGRSVDRALAISGGLDVVETLRLAARIARALQATHAARIIHKDVNPSNVVWNREDGTVKLIDFGISTELRRETAALVNPSIIEGTLTHMSPEQTGRMNRPIDSRTDLYSFGATLYQLFAGRLPFESDDAMELVHFQLARQPAPLHEVDKAIPPIIGRIVARLMEKNPEDRYQSAAGVAADLERCLRIAEADGALVEFALGEEDFSGEFRVPDVLYGRDAEIARLMEAFGRAADGPVELVAIAGYSGIGKSALVHEVQKPIVARRGLFTSGKFDQFNRNVPYASLAQAFQELIRQLLTTSEAELAAWRERLETALGSSGQVVAQVIPEIELIVGPQPPVPPLAPLEAQNRFELVFQGFVRALCSPEAPLTVFLDDLQWADGPSLALLRHMMTSGDLRHLLLIGAYRDNEVDPQHPLMLSLAEIEEAGRDVTTITLEPLGFDHVASLLADTLGQRRYAVQDLTELCIDKTGGNPFFLRQLLAAVHERDGITFDRERLAWTWNVGAIAAMDLTENVVDLMAAKIRRLDPATQQVLKLAACVGARFDLHTLAIVHEASPKETAAALWPALTEGLVLPTSGDWRYVRDVDDALAGAPSRVQFRWLHDRVQQAAYSLFDEAGRQAVHDRVGRLMLAQLTADERDDKLFEIVNHLNRGAASDLGIEARRELAGLNLEAGRKAVASAAYGPAARFFEAGIDYLGDDRWSADRDRALTLHEEAAGAHNLVPDFERMEAHVGEVLAHARTPLEKVRVYEIRILGCQAQARVADGIGAALEILALLGVEFPAEPTQEDLGAHMAMMAEAMGDRPVDALAAIPGNPDPGQVAAIRILANIMSTAYIGAPQLFPLMVLRGAAMSAKHGDTGASAYLYVNYGTLLAGVLDQFDAGYAFGRLAQAVIDKYECSEFAARVAFNRACFVDHWSEPLRGPWGRLLDIYKLGLDTGDKEFAAWPICVRTFQGFFLGLPLKERLAEADRLLPAFKDLKQETSGSYAHCIAQAMAGLTGATPYALDLKGGYFDEGEAWPRYVAASEAFGICNLCVTRILLHTHFGQYGAALEEAARMEPYLAAMTALAHVPAFHFYTALSRIGLARESADPETRANLLAGADASIERLAVWAGQCPENFDHKHKLLCAERAGLDEAGDTHLARRYREAIEAAASSGYLHEEALAYELAGRSWLRLGDPELAHAMLARARHRYELWGAAAKVRVLDEEFGITVASRHVRTQGARRARRDTRTTITSTSSAESLDLGSVLKASQAISSSVERGELFATMVAILMENAGAERGALLVERDGALRIEARGAVPDHGTEAAIRPDDIEVTGGLPVATADGAPRVPQSIVQYVARTAEHVLIDDAAADAGRFASDLYLRDRRPRSVLCTPIVHHGELAGVLYLENNLSAGVFTDARLAALDMLSAQAAVSLENMHMFENQKRLADSFARFVPREFLQHLGREAIVDVALGDSVQQDATVLFSDLRNFTSLSERMSAREIFDLLNGYLRRMNPIIERHGGFIDKFIGDAIMALFVGPAEHAVRTALGMHDELRRFNEERERAGHEAIHMGIGLHTGPLMLGTVGGPGRMDTTVIGDTVNVGARIESATKEGGVGLLISAATAALVRDVPDLDVASAGEFRLKGKAVPVELYTARLAP